MTQRKTTVTVGKDIYLLNKLTALDECLAARMNQLMNEIHPEWLTESSDPQKKPTRPASPGIIVAEMNRHMIQYMRGPERNC